MPGRSSKSRAALRSRSTRSRTRKAAEGIKRCGDDSIKYQKHLKMNTDAKPVCQFCSSADDDESKYGTIYRKKDVTVHYFCMLLSSGLYQNTITSDRNGILGFLLADIKKEIWRGKKLTCCYCRKKGATIGCFVRACKKSFHLPCGRQHGTMHQFYQDFRSYCHDHRMYDKTLTLPPPISSKVCPECPICTNAITSRLPCDTVWSPCCLKYCFHHQCMQKYAMSAGLHFFKCPACSCVKKFQNTMLKYGIYIPDQDASWEREPNAYHDLLEQHDTCDALVCQCPKGRKYDAFNGKFEYLLCQCCGSFGSHRACKALTLRKKEFLCPSCADIADKRKVKEKEEQEQSTMATPRKRPAPCREMKIIPLSRSPFPQVCLRSQEKRKQPVKSVPC